MEKKKVFSMSLFGVAGVLLLFAVALIFGNYSFSMTEEMIQTELRKRLPMKTSSAEIEAVDVVFTDNDTVSIYATSTLSRLGQSYRVAIEAVGVPEYRFISGEFYFNPEQIRVASLEQTGGLTVTDAIDDAGSFMKKLFPKRTEAVDEMTSAAQQLAPDIQEWMQGVAELMAVNYLKYAPIYKLPDDVKGVAAQAVLEDVYIQDSKLTIKLSLYRLGTWVLIFGISGLLALGSAVAMMRR